MAKAKKQGSGACGTISWLIGAMAGAYLIYVMLIDLKQEMLISVIAGVGAMIVVGFVLGLILCARGRNRVADRLAAATPVAVAADGELFAGQAAAGPARVVPVPGRAATLGQPDADALDRKLEDRLAAAESDEDADSGDEHAADFSDEYDDYEDEAAESDSGETEGVSPLKLTDEIADGDDAAAMEEQVRTAVEALATGLSRPAAAPEADGELADGKADADEDDADEDDADEDDAEDVPEATDTEPKNDSADQPVAAKSDKAAAVAAAIRAIASEVRDDDDADDTDAVAADDGDVDIAVSAGSAEASDGDDMADSAELPVQAAVAEDAADTSDTPAQEAEEVAPEPAVPAAPAVPSGDATPAIKPLKPTGLDAPEGGQADDLTLIEGIGASQAAALNEAGIYHYTQIVTMNRRELAWLDENIPGEDGQNASDSWRKQAIALGRKAD